MPRPYRSHRRRRPGRRPPHRYSGFTPRGFDSFYRAAMPGLAGREKRDFFNGIARWLIAGVALGGAILGLCWLGPLGAFLGLAAGLMAGARFAASGRFFRE